MLIGWWQHVQVWEMMSSYFLCQLSAVGDLRPSSPHVRDNQLSSRGNCDCDREEDLERLMEAVCRWRMSQGGPPQAADNGCTGDGISGGKMYPGPATSPPRRASQFSLAPLSTPAHRLTHLFQRGQKRKPFALISRLRKAEATREGGHRRRHEPMRAQRGVHVPPRVRAVVAGGVGAAGQPPREDGRHTPRSPDPLAASPGASDPVAVRRQRSEEAVRKGAARGRGRTHGGSAQSSVAATSCDAASATTS